jgi:HEAT repeat protein
MKIRRTLTCLLASFVLVPAFAQVPRATPRELYERAAFAEEHDHDLAAAEKGYREAADAAARGGDADLAKKAGDALARVLARQGKAAAQSGEPAQLFPQAQRLIAEGSNMDPSAPGRQKLVEDLLVFGRALVPALEPLLIEPTPGKIALGEHLASVNPEFAARVLARLDLPEATEALGKGLESPDPLVRKAVVGQLSAPRHLELLQRAASDPVPPVRDLAFEKLQNTPDPALHSLMMTGARQGAGGAVNWLGTNDGLAVLELVDEGSVEEAALPHYLYRQQELIWDLATVEQLVQLRRSARKESVRKSAHSCLRALLEKAVKAGPLDPALEAVVLHEIESDPTPDTISLLGYVTPQRGFETIMTLLESSQALLSDAEQSAYYEALTGIQGRNPPVGDFHQWLRAYQAAARRTAWEEVKSNVKIAPDASNSALCLKFGRPAIERDTKDDARDTKDAELLAWFQGLGSVERERYMNLPWNWIIWRMRGRDSGKSSARIDRSMVPVIEFVLDTAGPQDARVEAIHALLAVGEANQFERCVDEYARSNNDEARVATFSIGASIALLDPSHAAEVLERRIGSILGEVPLTADHRRVIEAIDWLPETEALALFRRLWTAPMGQDARSVLLLKLIETIDGPTATALLLELYPDLPVDSQGGDLRYRAINRFAAELYEPAIPLLEQALKDPSDNVRAAARGASEAFKQQRMAVEEFQSWTSASRDARDSIDELKALLADSNRDVVLGAVKALAAVKARTALPELVKLLGRDDPPLKQAVQAAIDRIGE